jgi:hypothetical protein
MQDQLPASWWSKGVLKVWIDPIAMSDTTPVARNIPPLVLVACEPAGRRVRTGKLLVVCEMAIYLNPFYQLTDSRRGYDGTAISARNWARI